METPSPALIFQEYTGIFFFFFLITGQWFHKMAVVIHSEGGCEECVQ